MIPREKSKGKYAEGVPGCEERRERGERVQEGRRENKNWNKKRESVLQGIDEEGKRLEKGKGKLTEGEEGRKRGREKRTQKVE